MNKRQAIDTEQPKPLQVWYDSECPLCRREIGLLKRLDAKQTIDFIEIKDCSTLPMEKQQLLARLYAQQPDGEIISGAEVFAAIWRKLPGLSMLGYVARWQPALVFMEWLYLKFLKYRPGMQQWLINRGME
ncbi:MAG: DUF393 domain-containing protein [Candidatus Thiodiazotropha weberae]|nr:DUF393 domain-containing protein [Candidatus Thiodiazotropha weberae]MCG7916069.1 DUF393 domain-containing protein [Candidatus Thiodiazotropha weberae]